MIAKFFANRSCCKISAALIVALRWAAIAILVIAVLCALFGCASTTVPSKARQDAALKKFEDRAFRVLDNVINLLLPLPDAKVSAK